MIGTCREIMYALSLKFKWNKDLPLTAKQKLNLTQKVRTGMYGEKFCEKYLPIFGAVKIREPYTIPALYINNRGVIIDEDSLREIITSVKKWHGDKISSIVAHRVKTCHYSKLEIETMNWLASSRGFKLYKERITFPSIWELKQVLDSRYFPNVDLTKFQE